MVNASSMEEESALDVGVRTASTASFVLAGKIVSFALGALTVIVIARILGPSIYGIYILAAAVAGLFGSVGSMGIATAFSKFGAEYRARRELNKVSELASNGHAVLLAAGIVLVLITMAASVPIASYSLHNPHDAYLLQVISLSILASMLMGAGYSMLIGIGRASHAAAVSMTASVLQASVGISLAVLGFGALAPVLGLVVSQVGGYFVAMVLLILRDGISLGMPTLAGMRKLLSFSMPVALYNVFGSAVSSVSPLVLGIFATTVVLGNFGIASNTNAFFDIILGSITITLLPTFSSTLVNSKLRSRIGEFFNYSLYMAFLMVTPLIIFVAALAKPVSYVAFSGQYTLAPVYIRLVAIGLLISIAGSYASTLLISASEVRRVMRYGGLIAIVQLALLFVLVPEFKGIGLITLLFIITPLAGDILYISGIVRVLKVRFSLGKLSRVFLANVISIAPALPLSILWGGNYIPLLATSAAAMLLLYTPVLVLVGGISESDLGRIRAVSSNVPVVGRIINALLAYGFFVG